MGYLLKCLQDYGASVHVQMALGIGMPTVLLEANWCSSTMLSHACCYMYAGVFINSWFRCTIMLHGTHCVAVWKRHSWLSTATQRDLKMISKTTSGISIMSLEYSLAGVQIRGGALPAWSCQERSVLAALPCRSYWWQYGPLHCRAWSQYLSNYKCNSVFAKNV